MEQRTAEMYAAFITNNPEAGTLFAIVSYGGSMLSKYSHGVRLPESKPR